MHEVWTIPTTNMMYTRSQNYTNMVVGKHKIQTFKVVIVLCSCFPLLSFDFIFLIFPTSAHPLLFLEEWQMSV